MRINTKAQTGNKVDGLYYTDHFQKNQVDRELSSTLGRYNGLKLEFEKVSKYKVESFTEFLELLENPTEFYKGKHLATVEGSQLFKQLEALNMDTATLIKIPSGFDTVVQMANMVNRSGAIPSDRFMVHDGRITATPEFRERMYRRVHFRASTPEQQERLSIAYSLIEAYKLIEPIIYQQLKQSRADECVKQKLHFRHSLPYQLKAVNDGDGVKIIPNPEWVENGFEGTDFLGVRVFSKADIAKAEADRQRIEASRPVRAPYETIIHNVNNALNEVININNL